jgi:VCBS repeat-containing protein
LLTGVAIYAWEATGVDEVRLDYEVTGEVTGAEIAFYRAETGAAPELHALHRLTITDAALLQPGAHALTLPIGTTGVPLPGAGSAETTTDYALLAVLESVQSSGEASPQPQQVARLHGVYRGTRGAVFVHGTDQDDSITLYDRTTVQLNDQLYAFESDSAIAFRVRSHEGADQIDAASADVPLVLHGGDGDDILKGGIAVDLIFGGGGDDEIDGGPGLDRLDGQDGSDIYVTAASMDTLDRMRDSGTVGFDRMTVAAPLAAPLPGNPLNSLLGRGLEGMEGSGSGPVHLIGSAAGDRIDLSHFTLAGSFSIDGAAGDDSLIGSASDDLLKGGGGNDRIEGGIGQDTAVFSGPRGRYRIREMDSMVIVQDMAPSRRGGEGTDRLVQIERLQFADTTIDVGQQHTATITAANDHVTVGEDSGILIIPVLNNDTLATPDGTLRVQSIERGSGLGIVQVTQAGQAVLFSTNGAYGHLRADEVLVERFRYTVVDAAGNTAQAELVVTVEGSNDIPVARFDTLQVPADASNVTWDLMANDLETDLGDPATIVSIDGTGEPETWTLVIIYGVGAPLRIPAVPPLRGSVAIDGSATHVSYTTGNAFRYLAQGQTATDSFRYEIVDSFGARSATRATATVLGVNDAPHATIDHITVAANASSVLIDPLANDWDVDHGARLSLLSVTSTSGHGGLSISSDGKRVSYTVPESLRSLAVGQSQIETWTYVVRDEFGATSTGEIRITIVGGNLQPLVVDDNFSLSEDSSSATLPLLANDTDPDSTSALRIVELDTSAALGTISIATGGTHATYTPGSPFQHLPVGASAIDSFGYTVQDAFGATTTGRVTVEIRGANDAPVLSSDSHNYTAIDVPAIINVLANDGDVDSGDTLRILGVTPPASLAGTLTIADGGQSLSYTSNGAYRHLRAGASVSYSIPYTVIDSQGAVGASHVALSIAGVNDPPTANPDQLLITEDATTATISVLANDVDPDSGDTKRVVSIDTTGLLGTATVSSTGNTIQYQVGPHFQYLTAGQTATETFRYTMRDAAGALSSAEVRVVIQGVTDGPVASPDGFLTSEDSTAVSLPVLANDFHDASPAELLSIESIDTAGIPASIDLILIYGVGVGRINPGFPALRGSLAIAEDRQHLIYTPFQELAAGESFVDMFKYTIRDATGARSSAIGTVTVTGSNDAPQATPDATTISFYQASTTLDVLANDTDVDHGDILRIVSVSAPDVRGSVSISDDGQRIVYERGTGFEELLFGQTATETFSYTLADASGAESTAIVTVSITGPNHAPVAVDDTAEAQEDGLIIEIPVLVNDRDVDLPAGDDLHISAIDTSATQGNVVISAGSASLQYDVGNSYQSLAQNATATDTVQYTIADSLGQTSTALVEIVILGQNDPPAAHADRVSLSEDAGVSLLSVLDNDIDVDQGDTLAIVGIDTSGVLSQVEISADGQQLRFQVAESFQSLLSGQTVTETLTYTVEDSHGASSTATLTVTIVGANEPVIYIHPPAPQPGDIVGTTRDETLTGTSGNDVMHGQGGEDDLRGAAGNDTIFGGADRDDLDGGAGDDILSGGADRDDLTGGSGADLFRYYLVSESTPSAFDRIRDFDATEGDRIDLSLIDANTIAAGNNSFVVVSAFTGAAGQLRIVIAGATTMVLGDVNGDGIADLQIEVRSETPLTADHLIV